jgi:hypothetical protein
MGTTETQSDAPAVMWRVDRQKVYDVARRIAKASEVIDPRVSDDMKAIHGTYELLKSRGSFSQAAEDARAMWIADVIFHMLIA